MDIPLNYYLCSYTLGNFTYLFRCRAPDHRCCGYSCCQKKNPSDGEGFFTKWYFWSLLLIVVIALSCIVLSYAISKIKNQNNVLLRNLRILSSGDGSNLANLSTSVIGASGIIQPKLHYVHEPSVEQKSGEPSSSEIEEIKIKKEWIKLALVPLSPPYKTPVTCWNDSGRRISSIERRLTSAVSNNRDDRTDILDGVPRVARTESFSNMRSERASITTLLPGSIEDFSFS